MVVVSVAMPVYHCEVQPWLGRDPLLRPASRRILRTPGQKEAIGAERSSTGAATVICHD